MQTQTDKTFTLKQSAYHLPSLHSNSFHYFPNIPSNNFEQIVGEDVKSIYLNVALESCDQPVEPILSNDTNLEEIDSDEMQQNVSTEQVLPDCPIASVKSIEQPAMGCSSNSEHIVANLNKGTCYQHDTYHMKTNDSCTETVEDLLQSSFDPTVLSRENSFTITRNHDAVYQNPLIPIQKSSSPIGRVYSQETMSNLSTYLSPPIALGCESILNSPLHHHLSEKMQLCQESTSNSTFSSLPCDEMTTHSQAGTPNDSNLPYPYDDATNLSNLPPPYENDTSIHSNLPPPYENVTSIHSNLLPPYRNVTPIHSNLPPPYGSVTPIHSNLPYNDAANLSNLPPSYGYAMPIHSNLPYNAANLSNLPPSYGYAMPIHSNLQYGNITSIHSNLPPSYEEGSYAFYCTMEMMMAAMHCRQLVQMHLMHVPF